jgi:surfactin synthase thioesterase subunit
MYFGCAGSGSIFFRNWLMNTRKIFRLVAVVRPPHGLQKAPMFERFALARHQVAKEIEFLWRQPHRAALDQNFSAFEIDFEIARNIRGNGLARKRCAAGPRECAPAALPC